MKVLVTTVVRQSTHDEASGFLRMVDLDERRQLSFCAIPEPHFLMHEINPRGGLRGGKGIALLDGLIAIANASHIRLYDYQWKLIRTITHPSCASIHDICARNGKLWVASTRNDLVLEMDIEGRIHTIYDYRKDQATMNLLGLKINKCLQLTDHEVREGVVDYRDPRTHKIETTNTGHLNSIAFLKNGDLLISLGRLTPAKLSALLRVKGVLTKFKVYPLIVKANQLAIKLLGLKKQKNSGLAFVPAKAKSAILQVTPDGVWSVPFIFDQTTVPNHSLLPLLDGSVLYDDTNNGMLLRLDLDQHKVVQRIAVAEDFLRGAERLSDDLVAVGSQHTLHIVSLSQERVLDSIALSGDERESIFDIQVVPDDLERIPEQLEL